MVHAVQSQIPPMPLQSNHQRARNNDAGRTRPGSSVVYLRVESVRVAIEDNIHAALTGGSDDAVLEPQIESDDAHLRKSFVLSWLCLVFLLSSLSLVLLLWLRFCALRVGSFSCAWSLCGGRPMETESCVDETRRKEKQQNEIGKGTMWRGMPFAL